MKQASRDENAGGRDPLNFCPVCGSGLAPFMGPEDGPAVTWAHPAHPTCRANWGFSLEIISYP